MSTLSGTNNPISKSPNIFQTILQDGKMINFIGKGSKF
jgi:hypothetical protein